MIGINIAETGHVVNVLPPVSTAGGKTGDIFTMENYAHATIIIQAGATDADAGFVTIQSCDDFAAGNAADMVFNYYAETTAAGDTLGARTAAVAATGIDVSANDSIMYVIEIDANELPATQPCIQVSFSAPGGANLMSAVAILSGSRYAGDQSATAIA